jgi:23S rRNA pseudouridine2605 synthase
MTFPRGFPVNAGSVLLRQVLLLNLLFTARVASFISPISPPRNMHHCRLYSGDNGKGSLQRIERILSNRGAVSRTEAAKLIRQGRIMVNDKIVKTGSARFPQECNVKVDGNDLPRTPVLAMFHKPIGMVSSIGDPWGRSHLGSLSERWPVLAAMHPVGRLDMDTSGLLLFCSDGSITQALLNPSSSIPRIYVATVEGAVDTALLRNTLAQGVSTTEGTFLATLISAEVLEKKIFVPNRKDDANNDEDDKAGSIVARNEEDLYTPKISDSVLKVCSKVELSVCEGKYRMVRRILHNAGHSVVNLHRVAYGNVSLGNLSEGELQICSQVDEEWASSLLVKAKK